MPKNEGDGKVFGIPFRVEDNPLMWQVARKLGKKIELQAGYVAYQWDGKIYLEENPDVKE
jgi:hypothetical protein